MSATKIIDGARYKGDQQLHHASKPMHGSHSASAGCTASTMKGGASVLRHQYKQLVLPDVGRCRVLADAKVMGKHL